MYITALDLLESNAEYDKQGKISTLGRFMAVSAGAVSMYEATTCRSDYE